MFPLLSRWGRQLKKSTNLLYSSIAESLYNALFFGAFFGFLGSPGPYQYGIAG